MDSITIPIKLYQYILTMTYTGLKFRLAYDSTTVYTVTREPDLIKAVDNCLVDTHNKRLGVVTHFLVKLVEKYPESYLGYEIIELPLNIKISSEPVNIF